jgi:predicted phage-related endonuclease
LWQEKRGEVGPEDLSANLIVQLGLVTEDLNRQWYERNAGKAIKDVQARVRHPVIRWMAATLDGVVAGSGAVYEAKFMLPWSFSEEFAADKYMAQLQHNMWVTNARMAALSIISGELRLGGWGGRSCTGPVNRSPHLRQRWPRRRSCSFQVPT